MSEIRVDNIKNEAGDGPPNIPFDGTDSGLAATNVQDAIDEVAAASPIGGYIAVQTNLTGAEEPDPDTHIKLTAGDAYNAGKMDNELVSGSAPLVEATAEIVDPESPLSGQIVHLLNTEDRYLQPGESAGTVADDVMQLHDHFSGMASSNESAPRDLIGHTRHGTEETNAGGRGFFDGGSTKIGTFSGGSSREGITSDPRGDARTDDHTAPKHIEVTYYMRIK